MAEIEVAQFKSMKSPSFLTKQGSSCAQTTESAKIGRLGFDSETASKRPERGRFLRRHAQFIQALMDY